MFPFRKRSSGQAVAGVYLDPRGVACAAVEKNRGRKPRLLRAAWQPAGSDADDAQALRSLANQARLAGEQTHLVLGNGEYQLLLVEAPRVEPSELRAAVRWKVKDLIDFHIDDAVIDVFEIPGQENRPHAQSMMYAVVARSRQVRDRIDQVGDAELQLEVIDITEMALRNLASLLDEDARGVVTLYMAPDYGMITVTRQGNLYLTRRLETGTDALTADENNALDQLVLEIQRSLDYYDSHFSQPPLRHLKVLPGFDGHDRMVQWLDNNLGVEVTSFDASRLLDCQVALEGEGLGPILVAVGGALRHEEISL